MRILSALILTTILAFTASGCEREDLSYDTPAPEPSPTDTTQHPTLPDDGQLRLMAAQTAGIWTGTLDTKYIDYLGLTHTDTCQTRLTFDLDAAQPTGGQGLEVDSAGGKQVFWMRFGWQVMGDGRLRLVYTDSRTMYSTLYRHNGSTLTLQLVKDDGLETDNYLLRRVDE